MVYYQWEGICCTIIVLVQEGIVLEWETAKKGKKKNWAAFLPGVFWTGMDVGRTQRTTSSRSVESIRWWGIAR